MLRQPIEAFVEEPEVSRQPRRKSLRSFVTRSYEDPAVRLWAWRLVRLLAKERKAKRFTTPHSSEDFIRLLCVMLDRYGATRKGVYRISETDCWSIARLVRHLVKNELFEQEEQVAIKKGVELPALPKPRKKRR